MERLCLDPCRRRARPLRETLADLHQMVEASLIDGGLRPSQRSCKVGGLCACWRGFVLTSTALGRLPAQSVETTCARKPKDGSTDRPAESLIVVVVVGLLCIKIRVQQEVLCFHFPPILNCNPGQLAERDSVDGFMLSLHLQHLIISPRSSSVTMGTHVFHKFFY